MFRVSVSDDHVITATVSGRVRLRRFRILKGDTVTVEVDESDITKGRIVFDKKDNGRRRKNNRKK